MQGPRDYPEASNVDVGRWTSVEDGKTVSSRDLSSTVVVQSRIMDVSKSRQIEIRIQSEKWRE